MEQTNRWLHGWTNREYCTRKRREVDVATDATATMMVMHLKQLKPVFEKNADVIAAGMWGMYGFWGEQWGTKNSTGYRFFEANDSTRIIFQAMIDNTPVDRMFLMRYTYTMRQLMGDEPCPENEAFTGTIRSRVGHYNDCFLAEGSAETDNDEGPWSYTSVQGNWTPDLAVADPNCGVRPTVQSVKENLENQHFDFIDIDIWRLTGMPQDDPEIREIYKNLGYRYRLIKSSVTKSSENDKKILILNLDITNDGYSGIFNPRGIEVIMRDKVTGMKYVQEIKGDSVGNRKFFPYSHLTKTWYLKVDYTQLPEAEYEILLNFPDPYPTIHNRPEYSIHLANKNIWEPATGYNKLGITLNIKKGADGKIY